METQKFLPKNQKTDFTKELSITSGKMPPNATDIEKLVIGALS